MLNFEELARIVFHPLVDYYNFKIYITDALISLNNDLVSVNVYFENHFEVNTYLRVEDDKQDINLIALSDYLSLDHNSILCIASNQITEDDYLLKYLECVRNVLIVVLNLVENDRILFNECLMNYHKNSLEYRKERQLHDAFSLLNNLWHKKEYNAYLICFQKNMELIMGSNSYSLAHKRALYIRKHFPWLHKQVEKKLL